MVHSVNDKPWADLMRVSLCVFRFAWLPAPAVLLPIARLLALKMWPSVAGTQLAHMHAQTKGDSMFGIGGLIHFVLHSIFSIVSRFSLKIVSSMHK